MEVKCHSCAAEYHFDASAIPPAGLAVKCTACSSLFQVHPSLAAGPAETGIAAPWLVRQVSGAVFAVQDLPTLERWIREHRVSRDDLLATDGKSWQRLGNVAELAPAFALTSAAVPEPTHTGVSPLAAATRTFLHAPAQAPTSSTRVVNRPTDRAHSTLPPGANALTAPASAWQVTAPTASVTVPGAISMAPPPAYHEPESVPLPRLTPQPFAGALHEQSASLADGGRRTTGRRTTMDEVAERYPEPGGYSYDFGGDATDDVSDVFVRRRGRTSLVLFCLLLVTAGGAGAVYVLRPDWVATAMTLVRRAPVAAAALQSVDQGYVTLRRDSVLAIHAAMDKFSTAIRIDNRFAEARAGLAEAHLALAEVTRAQADDLERYAAQHGKKEQVRRADEIADLRHGAAGYAEKALSLAKEALQLAPESVTANRALARYYFVTGSEDKHLLERARAAAPQDARVLYLLAATASARHEDAGAEAYFKAAIDAAPDFNRARYRLAQLYRARGDNLAALSQVRVILANTPEHELAQSMLSELQPAADPEDGIDSNSDGDNDHDGAPAHVPPPVASADKDANKKDTAPKQAAAKETTPKDEAGHAAAAKELAHNVKSPTPTAAATPTPAVVAAAATPASSPTIAQSSAMQRLPMHSPFGRAPFTPVPRQDPPPPVNEGENINALNATLSRDPRSAETHFALAEAYRAKGQKRDAVKHYRQTLAIDPDGPKAAASRQRLEELSK